MSAWTFHHHEIFECTHLKFTVKSSFQPNRCTSIYTHVCNPVMVVWSSLRLAPTMHKANHWASTNVGLVYVWFSGQHSNKSQPQIGKQLHLFCLTFHSRDTYAVIWNLRYRLGVLWTVPSHASELRILILYTGEATIIICAPHTDTIRMI